MKERDQLDVINVLKENYENDAITNDNFLMFGIIETIVARHAIAVACPPLNNGACPHLPKRPAKGHVVRIVYGCQTILKKEYFLPKMIHISLYTLAKKS